QHAGAHFDEGIFSNKWIYHGLEHVSALCSGEIVVCLKDLVCRPVQTGTFSAVRAGEEADDVRQKVGNALGLAVEAHSHRNDLSVHNLCTHSCADLLHRELLSCKVPLHELLACLFHSLQKFFSVNLQIRLAVIRDLALFSLTDACVAASCILDDIDIAYQFLIFTDGLEMGRDHFAVAFCQLLHNLAEAGIVHVHLCHVHHTGQ